MAKVTHVKKAQQRYETVPVIDPETGEQKRTQVFRADGTPKTSKRGAEVWRNITVEDRTKPLPPHTCGSCQNPIEVGTPYKWIAPKSGPYGGRKLFRHESCPTWQVWEYSSSLSARISQIESEYGSPDFGSVESEEEAQDAFNELAQALRDLAEEKEEAANNIVDGFGHETYQSEEIQGIADQLNEWADEVENATIPDFPEVDTDEVECPQCGGNGQIETECPECGGNGEVFTGEDNDNGGNVPCPTCSTEDAEFEGTEDCGECGGTGTVEPDEEEVSEEALQEWRDEVDSVFQDALGANPGL